MSHYTLFTSELWYLKYRLTKTGLTFSLGLARAYILHCRSDLLGAFHCASGVKYASFTSFANWRTIPQLVPELMHYFHAASSGDCGAVGYEEQQWWSTSQFPLNTLCPWTRGWTLNPFGCLSTKNFSKRIKNVSLMITWWISCLNESSSHVV